VGSGIHSLSHVTGGGIAANLARVLPQDTWVDVDRSTWSPSPVFRVLADIGELELTATEGTWNLGIGFLAVVAADGVPEHLAADICQQSKGDPMIHRLDVLFKLSAQEPADEGHQRLEAAEKQGDNERVLHIEPLHAKALAHGHCKSVHGKGERQQYHFPKCHR
jgi:hypothetical protein